MVVAAAVAAVRSLSCCANYKVVARDRLLSPIEASLPPTYAEMMFVVVDHGEK